MVITAKCTQFVWILGALGGADKFSTCLVWQRVVQDVQIVGELEQASCLQGRALACRHVVQDLQTRLIVSSQCQFLHD